MKKIKLMAIVICIMSLFTLVGCTASATTPDKTVEMFMHAMIQGNTKEAELYSDNSELLFENMTDNEKKSMKLNQYEVIGIKEQTETEATVNIKFSAVEMASVEVEISTELIEFMSENTKATAEEIEEKENQLWEQQLENKSLPRSVTDEEIKVVKKDGEWKVVI